MLHKETPENENIYMTVTKLNELGNALRNRYFVGEQVQVTHNQYIHGRIEGIKDEICEILAFYPHFVQFRTVDRPKAQLIFCMQNYDVFKNIFPRRFEDGEFDGACRETEID